MPFFSNIRLTKGSEIRTFQLFQDGWRETTRGTGRMHYNSFSLLYEQLCKFGWREVTV